MIDSSALARAIAEAFADRIPARAYELRLSEGTLMWIEQVRGNEVVHLTEPGTGWWERFSISALSLMPIEPLL